MDSVWMLRNYHAYREIVPLQRSVYYPSDEKSYRSALFDFISCWGGSAVGWYDDAEINYFLTQNRKLRRIQRPTLPSHIYTSAFNEDSLRQIEEDIFLLGRLPADAAQFHTLDTSLRRRLVHYTASVRQELPRLYYFGARLAHFRNFHIHTGSKDPLPPPDSPARKIYRFIKALQSGFYVFTVVMSTAAAVYVLLRRRQRLPPVVWFLLFIAAHVWLTIPLVIGYSEIRYLISAYPAVILGAAYGCLLLEQKFLRWRNA
jgi:hypothetical protein